MKGFWNGEPATIRPILIRIKEHSDAPPLFWGRPFYGSVRQALEISQRGQTFVIDNNDGQGFYKVTDGLGSPQCGHKSIFAWDEIDEVEEGNVQRWSKSIADKEVEIIEDFQKRANPEEFIRLQSLKATIERMHKERK